MKKKTMLGTSLATLMVGLSVCSYHLGRYQSLEEQKNRVNYVEMNESVKSSEELTPEQVSAKEGIAAEQIVVKITDQGYVTSHGDHFHYYNGKVPYDAIISEELVMTDPNYVLQESHIVNEVKNGYIIKVNDRYFVYLKDKEKRDNIRTKEEIDRQKELVTNDSLKANQGKAVQGKGRYQTDDGYLFEPTDVIEDTGDGFIVPHGNHFHFIPKKDLSPAELKAAEDYWQGKKRQVQSSQAVLSQNRATTANLGGGESLSQLLAKLDATPLSQRHVEGDGLVFDPRTISKKTDSGVIVPHGDHYHFIPYSQMSDLEREIAQRIAIAGTNLPETPTITPQLLPKLPNQWAQDSQSSISKVRFFRGRKIVAYGQGLDGKPYRTDDGYQFSKESIDSVDHDGMIGKHGDHFHYVGFGELEAEELAQVEAWLSEKETKTNPTTETKLPQVSPADEMAPAFDSKLVQRKELENGSYVYRVQQGDKTWSYPQSTLDWTQIAFAELTLIEKDKNYILDIVAPKGNELAPANLVPVSKLPMHVGQATYDTGKSFIVPHIDHIHVVPYSWLSPEQLATVKYLMQHPEVRPGAWTDAGHNSEIANATPLANREGLKNWQIIYTLEEVQAARAQGRWATDDGYIFAAEDVLDPGAFVFKDAFSLPRAEGGSLRSVRKSELSKEELALVQALLDARAAEELAKSVTPIEERKGLKNWQIIYSAEELSAAKSDGRYVTQDGYIFDPADVLDPKTKIGDDHYRIPRAKEDGYHRVPKSELNYFRELLPAEAMAAKRDTESTVVAEQEDSGERPSISPVEDVSHPTPIAPAENSPQSLKAAEIYQSSEAQAIIPFEAIPYQLGYASHVEDGRFVVPHGDHNHYYAFYSFDEGHYQAPQGYSLSDLFATVKYYMAHPELRPESLEGWGK
ncbi:pneumococcal-type histidine triad protein [Streptococcus plurextorum]|uniref:pneumococcal-type histidine triad protein n=1 Tax=Streptococcus plurextorum TaxID=456876 RepID=UPI0003F56499|nr:pneumococcal-type histidine triad protein [Streptococcus plurextorum]